ncbi:MAG TPA: hypothetical protein VHL53_10055, partial [Acidimicrobiia bacterium]|nr:hypothetical protein [Acidimicrobiia bacterium]
VVSAALAVSVTRNQPGGAPFRLNLIFGRAFAAASANPGNAVPPGIIDSAPIEGGSSPTGTGIGADPSGGVASGFDPAGSVSTGYDSGTGAGSTDDSRGAAGQLGDAAGPASAAMSAAPTPLIAVPAAGPAGRLPRGGWFYLALVFAGAVAVAATVIMHRTIPALIPGRSTTP